MILREHIDIPIFFSFVIFKLLKPWVQIILNNKFFVPFETDFKIIDLFFSNNFHQGIVVLFSLMIFLFDILENSRSVLFLGDSIVIKQFYLKIGYLIF